MNKFADLHIHTYYSDGTFSPEEVVQAAVRVGLACISITDHDTVEGIGPTRQAATDVNVEVISGIELSSEINGKDVHVLGYCINEKHPALVDTIQKAQTSRVERIHMMIEKLKQMGVDNIQFEEVSQLTQSKSLGRPHLATILKQKGWVADISEAFTKYLGEGCPAYVPKYKLTPYEAIALIRKIGGVAVLAHPMITNRDELIHRLVESGLQGLEVYYPNCPAVTCEYYAKLAKKYNLIMTGGSDAHGKAKDNTFIGKTRIPYEYVEQLKKLSRVT